MNTDDMKKDEKCSCGDGECKDCESCTDCDCDCGKEAKCDCGACDECKQSA